MALGQRRMVYTNLWQNEDFSKMSEVARLIYIGLITLADDDGRLRGNSILIRSQLFPFHTENELPIDDFKKALNEVVKSKLIIFYKEDDGYFIQHPNWEKYQFLRKDRKKESNFPAPQPDVNQMSTKRRHKLSKDNIREERGHTSILYLKNIPEDDMKEFLGRFDVSPAKIRSKAEDFFLYCDSKGKVYRNYKSALLNAMKKDFPEKINKPIPSPIQIKIKNEEKTPIPQDIKDQINKIINNKTIKN